MEDVCVIIVKLEGGAPWGFRLEGNGSSSSILVKISQVRSFEFKS